MWQPASRCSQAAAQGYGTRVYNLSNRTLASRDLLQTPVGVAAGEQAGQVAVLLLGRGDAADVQLLGLAPGEAPGWAAADVLRGQAPLCLGSGVGASGRVRLLGRGWGARWNLLCLGGRTGDARSGAAVKLSRFLKPLSPNTQSILLAAKT